MASIGHAEARGRARWVLLTVWVATQVLVGGSTIFAQAQLAPDDWITVNKDLSSQRYVDLDRLTPENVGELNPLCEIELEDPSWFSSGILKVGTTLYFTSRRVTYAIDATTCEKVWRKVIDDFPPANLNNRGLAFLKGEGRRPDLLFRGSPNGKMIAHRADSGDIFWEKQAVDPAERESLIAAPVAANGIVYIGIATADLGVCGRVIAFDAMNGDVRWTYSTVPSTFDGKKYSCKWAGGAQWTSLSLDTETNELFVPVSNPNPDYIGSERPGANLHTNSVISLDATTTDKKGKLNWFYQAVPHDVHDWDLGTAPVLYEVDGHRRLAIAGKDGFVYGVDREEPHGLEFLSPGTTLADIDVPFPANDVWPPENAVRVCPGTIGGAQFTGPSFDPARKSLFVGMNDFCWFYFLYQGITSHDREAGHIVNTDLESPPPHFSAIQEDDQGEAGSVQPDFSLGKPPIGHVTAFDASSGAQKWRFTTPAQVQAGTVATKSGVVFAADTLGNLYALHAETGELLHQVALGGAVNSGLISYEVGDTQYVAAEVGGLSLNPPGITDPLRPDARLRVVILSRNDRAEPKIAKKLERPKFYEHLPEATRGELLYGVICIACHGAKGNGSAYPTLERQYHILTDPVELADFLATVWPPMPKLYPGLLDDDDIALLVAYFKTLDFQEQPGYVQPTSPPAVPWNPELGKDPWPSIYSVLTHPRCINCHPSTNYPRQTDDRHPHFYGVLRGASGDNKGSAIARCDSCHGETNNDFTGVPGAVGWQLAPLEDGWESYPELTPNVALNGATLCRKIREFASEHNLIKHLNTTLVEWAFDPGNDLYGNPRSRPKLTHAEFLAAVELWQKGGMPCPPTN